MNDKYILTVNSGSSSIKFSLFQHAEMPKRLLDGSIEKIGQQQAILSISGQNKNDLYRQYVNAPDHSSAVSIFSNLLKQKVDESRIVAIGHRVVHGGPRFYKPIIATDQIVKDLRALEIFDPLHIPVQVGLIEKMGELMPQSRQVACFDTAFHQDLPNIAKQLAIPRRYMAEGVRKYGFHGLSYSYLMEQIRAKKGAQKANGRIILAHLGNGASLAAVKEGAPIDTTMGLTPAAGIPMSTRSGDIDPGLVLYLSKAKNMNAEQFNDMVNKQSGLFGISEISSDMQELVEKENEDIRAAQAIEIFCYQVKKAIGSFTAALGGLDTLVFSGGMGEAAPKIRDRICRNLDFIGIQLDNNRNKSNEETISTDSSKVDVHVMHTDEAIMIAREVAKLTPQEKKKCSKIIHP